MGNDCENANTHTHDGVGTFTKKMKLELMWINSEMEQRRERFETPPVDSPMVPPVPYTKKIGFRITDRTLVSVGPAHSVSGSSEHVVSVS